MGLLGIIRHSQRMRGDIAGTVWYGGGGTAPNMATLIWDGFSAYPVTNGWEAYVAESGTSGGNNRWGDYLGVQRDDRFPNTWIATGYTLNGNAGGGGVNAGIQPRAFWFGRSQDNPNILGSMTDVGDDSNSSWDAFLDPTFGGTYSNTNPLWNAPYGRADVDLYRFQATAGMLITASTSQPSGGDAADTYLRLFDSAGHELYRDDDGGSGFYSLISGFSLPNTGTYYLGVSGYGNSNYNPFVAGTGNNGAIGDYRLTLTTTPMPGWAKATGSAKKSAPDEGRAIVLDSARNSYVAGSVMAAGDKISGHGDVFVAKYDPAGSMLWSVQFGGQSDDRGQGIAVDNAGDVYVTGYFKGTVDFNPDPVGTANLTASGKLADAFVAKFDTNGNFVWARAFGDAAANDRGLGIASDGDRVFLTGSFTGKSVDFDRTASYSDNRDLVSSTEIRPGHNSQDLFVLALDGAGNFLWVKGAGSSSKDEGTAITVAPFGSVFVTGSFRKTMTLDTVGGPVTLTSNGGADVPVLALDSFSGDVLWATSLGGKANNQGSAIAYDSQFGNLTVAGAFNGKMTVGADLLKSKGSSDVFVVQTNAGDGSVNWARRFGGAGGDQARGAAVVLDGSVYIAGWFRGKVEFDPTSPGAALVKSAGSRDGYLTRIDRFGDFVGVERVGGKGADAVMAVAADFGGGNVYLTGQFSRDAKINVGGSSVPLTSQGNLDVFVAHVHGVNAVVLSNAADTLAPSLAVAVDPAKATSAQRQVKSTPRAIRALARPCWPMVMTTR